MAYPNNLSVPVLKLNIATPTDKLTVVASVYRIVSVFFLENKFHFLFVFTDWLKTASKHTWIPELKKQKQKQKQKNKNTEKEEGERERRNKVKWIVLKVIKVLTSEINSFLVNESSCT